MNNSKMDVTQIKGVLEIPEFSQEYFDALAVDFKELEDNLKNLKTESSDLKEVDLLRKLQSYLEDFVMCGTRDHFYTDNLIDELSAEVLYFPEILLITSLNNILVNLIEAIDSEGNAEASIISGKVPFFREKIVKENYKDLQKRGLFEELKLRLTQTSEIDIEVMAFDNKNVPQGYRGEFVKRYYSARAYIIDFIDDILNKREA